MARPIVESRAGAHPVVIIGGGASGVLLAHGLSRKAPDLPVVIVEDGASPGRGLAYATNCPSHLLNVRSANMSALAAEPDHFLRWLRQDKGADSPTADPDGFAARADYGRYIESLLAEARRQGTVSMVRGRAISISATEHELEVLLQDLRHVPASFVVIATGHDRQRRFSADDPWRSAFRNDARHVALIGSGLTMVDCLLELLDRGFDGQVTAVSRRALLPAAHTAVPQPRIALEPPPVTKISALMRWLRTEIRDAAARGIHWQAVIDALRPETQKLWERLPLVERRRFLRHAVPYWNVARHRMAPSVRARLDAALTSGQLCLLRGRVIENVTVGEQRRLTIASPGTGEKTTVLADQVIDCSGLVVDPELSMQPLIYSLMASGLAVPDPLGLSLDVSRNCEVISARGQPSERIFAVGPLTRARFWEIVAIPDIRVQVEHLADQLAAIYRAYARQQAA